MGSNSSKRIRFSKRTTTTTQPNATTTTTTPSPQPPRPRPNATANSAFFQRLPAELRIRILRAAFGDRTLHVHGRNGCACRRAEMLQPGEDDTPARDACMREYLHYPTAWETPAETGGGWGIGAMGWLGVCRQAYTEGIQVLLKTSTFHVRTRGVDTSPLSLLPTAHLASIRSLEWVLGAPAKPVDASVEGPRFHAILHSLPSALPSLRRLYIGFCRLAYLWPGEGKTYYDVEPEEKLGVYIEQVLEPVDEMVRTGVFGGGRGLTELEIGMPTSAFVPHYIFGLGDGLRFERRGWMGEEGEENGADGPRRRVWRVVELEGGGETGYWLGETVIDVLDGWRFAAEEGVVCGGEWHEEEM